MSKSTAVTGISIANSMIGSSMILFPITFNQTGILINVLYCVFMSAIMALTCKLLVDHLRNDEVDISQSIRRKLGPAFGLTFAVLSSITMILVSSVFFLLAVDLFYDVFLELFGQVAISEKVFKLILMGVFALLNYLPDLKFVFKLAPVAMGALVVGTAILIISIAFNLDNISMNFLTLKPLGAKDLLTVASVNGFAFITHPSVSPMIKEHSKQKQNDKAVYFGYIITLFLYIIVGVLGALAVYGRVPPMEKSSYNIIDYFSGQFQAPVIGFLNFSYLFMISPIFPFVSKNQALQLIPKEKRDKIPKIWLKATIVFSCIWIPLNILFIVFDISPLKVIGFISTVMAFYVTYFLPVLMTIKVGDYVIKKVEKNTENEIENGNVQEDSLEDKLINPEKIVEEQEVEVEVTEIKRKLSEDTASQITDVEADNKLLSPAPPKKWQKIFYCGVLTYGSLLFVLELISFFA